MATDAAASSGGEFTRKRLKPTGVTAGPMALSAPDTFLRTVQVRKGGLVL